MPLAQARIVIDPRLRRTALLVAGCFFMENLDGTIVTTASPQIGASLHVPSMAASLVITAYLVTLAALIPLSGWLVARCGSRPVFVSAIALFTLASLACAASTSLTELVAMRVLQGAGGAMMVPVGRLMVLSRTAKGELMRVTAYLVWPALLAPVVAPLIGGAIVTYANWHWLFLINVPLGAIAILCAWRLTEALCTQERLPLDKLGVVLSCGGLAGLTFTAHLLSGSVVPAGQTLACGVASVALLVAAIRHLLSARAPLVNLRTLRVPTFSASVGGSTVFLLPVESAPFLLPLLFENVFHWSAVKAGAVVLFVFVGNVAVKPATSLIYRRFGFRTAIATAATGLAACTSATALLTAQTPLAVIIAVVLLSGVARSVGLTGYTTIAFADVGERQMADASTLASTAQQLAAGLGVAAAAVALRLPMARLLAPHAGLGASYAFAFVAMAGAALLAAAWALRLHPAAGEALHGGRRG